ncbi:Beta-mannosidase [Habropoda laboriosa]|uniref:beta-mannosidase n=1 Tax=Habropoda laboriosa TaxID=597456 RepID=A0A0L7QMF7_9HYME|nr:Beta-mannosidase [Habropoda laboriosa]
MSDSMERDKAEMLTPKEREEEEMKQELLDMKMYETWYTYRDMKQILGFINESKDMANMANDEKNAQKELLQTSNDCTAEGMLKSNLAQQLEIQEHNDTSQSMHSYRPNHTSPIRERISTHSCNSPDIAPAIADSRNSAYRGQNLDNEDMFVKLQDNSNMRDSYSHTMSKYISLKSNNSLQDSDIINSTETKMDTHSECNQKLDRWQINPLDSCVSENDVPLQMPNRPVVEDRMPFRLCKEAQTPEMLEKLLPALNIHLKQTAELWHSWHRTTDTKFQWGSPIQVGLAKDNSDKKSLTNIKTEQNQMEGTNKYNNERPNKRKSTLNLSPTDIRHFNCDEDEKAFKKKKTQFHEDTNKILHSPKQVSTVKYSETDRNSDYDNISTLLDNSETESVKMEHKKKFKERSSSELISLHSNKITPPYVRKNINKKKDHVSNPPPQSPLAHSSNEKHNTINLISKDNSNILTDKEILLELKKDSVNDKVKTSEKTKIKPLPLKGLSHRIKNECIILERIQREKRKKIEIEKEEAQKKENEERKKKEEFYKKQIEEKQIEEKQRVEKEKYREEQSKRWKTVVDMKSQKKINKEDNEKLQSLNRQNENMISEIIVQSRSFQENSTFVSRDMEIPENNFTNKVNCPICNKSFPSDKIETHAAGCEQYVSDSEYENDDEIFECHICSKYKTTNGIHYEDHVNTCLQRKHQHESLTEYSTNEVDNILKSPVRCYQPISEQTDSHIDYRKQFPSNSNITSNKHKYGITFPATVPGGIYTDLSKANIIPDNFIKNNDITNRWVGNQSVVYSKMFYANNNLLNAPKVVLIFHGVDTFSTIFLNQQKLGETSNMFLRYTFDVTKYLEIGVNLLEVFISSPVKIAETFYNEQALKYTIPPICLPNTYNGECHVNHIRKMQASFAWDWGPAFPSMGIWKSVEIIPVNEIYIMDITTDVYKEENFWNIIITVFLEVSLLKNNQSTICQILAILNINEKSNIYNSSSINLNINNEHIKNTIHLKVPADLVHEWWPNGYGNQTLYSLTVTANTSINVKQKTVRIGFRTVELVQKPLKKGLSFYFRINGIPIFAKGSNFIPASIFPELSAKMETIKHLLTSVKEANMNMLRVWGGGLYESELFYNIADEYGIMIWQDFMFACGMYPTTDEFLKLVKKEVIQNVQKLKNHPSIVLWAGNNENEAALFGNWYGTGASKIYKTDYIKLYVDIIKKEVEQLDSTRPFVVSSPSNGLHTEQYNYIGQDPYSQLYGDVHYYNYHNNGWDMHQYPRARFSSEYGFQSLPSIYSILPVAKTTADLDIYSNFMKHRQHLPLGMLYLTKLISKNFKIPETHNSVQNFENDIYLSQVNQAVSVKVQTEFYRQSMSELNEVGEGMTMGALYWQLNDVWQAPSWSSIVTYYVKEMDLSIYIVSDKLYPITNVTLEVNLYTLNSMKPVQSHNHYNITVGANAVTKIYDDLLKTSWILNSTTHSECQFDNDAKQECITALTLKDKTGISIAPRNYIYPSNGFKNISLPIANISVQINDYHLPGKNFNNPDIELELTTDNVALFVWLEAGNICGHFSENGFHMFENKKRVVFLPCKAITSKALRKNLKITTLSDIYNTNR